MEASEKYTEAMAAVTVAEKELREARTALKEFDRGTEDVRQRLAAGQLAYGKAEASGDLQAMEKALNAEITPHEKELALSCPAPGLPNRTKRAQKKGGMQGESS